VRAIFEHARHPYTRGLLASIPRMDSDPSQPLPTIEGAPPDLAALPAGCAFAPRCGMASPACRAARPDLQAVGDQHLSACFHHELCRA